MNPTVRSQEELFPWEEPDEPGRRESAAAPLLEPAVEPAAPAARSPVAEPARAGTVEPLADAADDSFEFPAAASLLERLEREIGLAPVEARERPAVAPKEYYAISEVCELVGLKPHVLRYWETQFPLLNPSKNRSGNRVYQRKEIKLILLVKHLLYEEKYTIEGAKAKMDRLRRAGELAERTEAALDAQTLDLLRAELDALQRLLTPGEPV